MNIDISLNDYAKQKVSKKDPFDFNTAKPQRPVPVKQNFTTPPEPKSYSQADREWWWRPILKWLEKHKAELLSLGWPEQELRALLKYEIWEDAGDAFVDKRDRSINICNCDGSIQCYYPREVSLEKSQTKKA